MLKRPLFQLILVQLKEFCREPGILYWGIGFPVLMAWGLGIAFTNKGSLVRNIAVIENRIIIENNVLRNFLANSESYITNDEKIYKKTIVDKKLGKINYKIIFTSKEKAFILLKRGTVLVILEEKDGKVKYYFDPMSNDAQLVYLQLSREINNNKNFDYIIPLIETGTRYIDFLIPGLISMGVMMSIMWGISYSLIEKRSKKLLRRLIATPMKKTSFLFSHFAARFILCCTEAACLFFFAYFYFDIKIEGSLIALFIIFLSGVIAFTGIAIFASSRTSKTEIGNGLVNVVVMPMMVLSGVFFSYHNFPEAVIPFIQKLPLTMLADGIRSIFIEGAVLKDVIMEVFYLLGTGILFFLAGFKIYKWY
ncbi:ABC transporter permease [Candidatus Desantisbacteria bacterium]|nr:ABC transporter permease [Candidatus Desantisbacteria bacterium]